MFERLLRVLGGAPVCITDSDGSDALILSLAESNGSGVIDSDSSFHATF